MELQSNVGLPSMTGMISRSPAIQDFWANFLAEADAPEDANSRFFEAFKIGTSEDEADVGVRLILTGVKTATSSLLCEYEAAGIRHPVVGDLSIVMDGRDEPICIIETIELVVQPFALVDEQFARDYGEWDCTLATWREKCRAYYSKQCETLGRPSTQELPLVCERFRVIFPRQTRPEADIRTRKRR